jgi:solute carrier family 25 (mitochondrial carnitine/acylcarnitine transporter), member 20/29
MEYIIGNSIGLSNILIGYPLDTIKVHFQRNNKMPKLDLNLYSGVKYPLYSSLLLNTFVFGNLKKVESYTQNSFLSGLYLGGIGSLIINPLEIRKIRSQVNYNNLVFKNYSGLKYTFLRESFGYGIYFSIYKKLNLNHSTFISGGTAGMISWLITYPIDSIRTKKLLKQPIVLGSLYNGVFFCLIRAFILDGMTFTIFEKTNDILLNKK